MEEQAGAEMCGGLRMPPASRITRTREIRALLRRGRKRKTSHLDVFFLSSIGAQARIGLVVPKYQRRAVDRNLVKRRLRELCRREVLPRLQGSSVSLDLLIRARREAYDATYRELRLGLLKITEELCSGESSWG